MISSRDIVEITISIHAPTRGATYVLVFCLGIPQISIHAPTRGATCANYGLDNALKISIHAPTRGATQTAVTHLARR